MTYPFTHVRNFLLLAIWIWVFRLRFRPWSSNLKYCVYFKNKECSLNTWFDHLPTGLNLKEAKDFFSLSSTSGPTISGNAKLNRNCKSKTPSVKIVKTICCLAVVKVPTKVEEMCRYTLSKSPPPLSNRSSVSFSGNSEPASPTRSGHLWPLNGPVQCVCIIFQIREAAVLIDVNYGINFTPIMSDE